MLWQIEGIVFRIVADLCITIAGLGCLYLIVTTIAVLRYPARCKARRGTPEPVTILKPLHGMEPHLPRRLLTLCEQRFNAPVQILCGVRDPADNAVEAVQILMKREPAIELIVDTRQCGHNPKVSNLVNMVCAARHDVLVIADSDIEGGTDYLAKITAELQRPGVGVVTCLYHGIAAAGLWSRYSALAINGHFLPNAILGLTLGLAKPCFGSTIAIRRSMLRQIGGIEAFADTLAEDYAIGEAVRAAGYDVVVPAFSVGHACSENCLRALLAHEHRVAFTLRSIDPVAYCGMLFTHPFPTALLGALLGSRVGLPIAAVALVWRVLLCSCVARTMQTTRQPLWLVPLGELLSFSVFVSGLFGTRMTWRGFTYRGGPDGRLSLHHVRAKP